MPCVILDPARLARPVDMIEEVLERFAGNGMTGTVLNPLAGSRIVVCGNLTCAAWAIHRLLQRLGAKTKRCFKAFESISYDADLYWRNLASALDVVPDFILDYGGTATRFIHEGLKAEEAFEATGKLPDLALTDDAELQSMFSVIKEELETNPKKYHMINNSLAGVCELTIDGAKRAYQMQANGYLHFPVINIPGSITKSKFGKSEELDDSVIGRLRAQHANYGGQLLTEAVIASQIKALTDLGNNLKIRGVYDLVNVNGHNLLEKAKLDVLNINNLIPEEAQLTANFNIRGKDVVFCGYGDKGKLAAAMKRAGAHVTITESNLLFAYQACEDGFKVCHLEDVVQAADVIITATGMKNTIMVPHILKMKDNTILMDIGHRDNEIDIVGLEACPGVKKIPIRHGFIYYFPETKKAFRVLVLPDGEPTSYTQMMGVIGVQVLQGMKDTGKLQKKVYVLSKEYDEIVAGLHLEHLGAKLTKCSTSYTTGSTSCETVYLDVQEHLGKRKASLMNRLALPNMKFKGA